MSLILWYKVVVEEKPSEGALLAAVASLVGTGLPLKVSNDPFSGQYILDADIILTMRSGATPSSFEITLNNLPADLGKTIKSKQKEGSEKKPTPAPLQVKVFLAYFENVPLFTARDPVLEGAVTRVKTKVNDQGVLSLQLIGQELAGYKLGMVKDFQKDFKGKKTAEDFLGFLADQAKLKLEGDPWTTSLEDLTLKSKNGLLALEDLSRRAKSAVVIRDGKIFRGSAVGSEKAPVTLDPDTNIVQADDDQDTEKAGPKTPKDKGTAEVKSISIRKVTTLGIPGLRAGQMAVVKDGGDEKPLRVHSVQHRFLTSGGGYTCDLVLVDAVAGEPVPNTDGVDGLVRRFEDFVRTKQDEKNPIDVGEVSAYATGADGKHLVTLNYGQADGADSVAPSVQEPIEDDAQLHNKPIASPFAWHKCGLVVPVYPTMRALLAHNKGAANDAAVAGFLWAEKPRQDRPKNKAGDYWLCLPTEVDPTTGQPKGAGANDLTDASGRRVVQAKGLHLMVGEKLLSPVGDRPDVADDLNGQILIEHSSGTTIKIDSQGAVTITAMDQPITLSNGSVTLALNGSSVEIK